MPKPKEGRPLITGKVLVNKVSNIAGFLMAMGLIGFVVGGVFIFTDQDELPFIGGICIAVGIVFIILYAIFRGQAKVPLVLKKTLDNHLILELQTKEDLIQIEQPFIFDYFYHEVSNGERESPELRVHIYQNNECVLILKDMYGTMVNLPNWEFRDGAGDWEISSKITFASAEFNGRFLEKLVKVLNTGEAILEERPSSSYKGDL